jgi:hypothetical protein
MIFKVVRVRVLRSALAAAVIVYDKITREPHQPVLKIALPRVVLFQRAIDAYKNFLRQILGSVRARGEAIG